MKTIKTSELRDGMRFDKPVYVDGENILVAAGVPIRQRDLDFLARFEIAEVATDGVPVVDRPSDGRSSIELAGVKELSGDKRNLEVYLRAIDEYEHLVQDVTDGKEPDRAAIDALAAQLLDRVKQNRGEMIHLILMGGRTERRISAGAVNGAILSAVIGMVLKYSGHRLNQLATGALLHDIGMTKVPKEILRKTEKLTPEDQNQIRTHPIHSYRFLTRELKYPEEIGVIALQHHEHWDGQGYPRRIKGEDINLSARIVAVADAYIAMINDRPHRGALIGYAAMKSVLNDNGRHFDPRVLKAFLESMGIYPIGSLVQLNNSSIGRVTVTHSEAPLRPVVELIIDEYGNSLSEREAVDLLERKGLFIVRAMDPRAIGAGEGGGAP